MPADRPRDELLPISIAARLIELGLDIQAGRLRCLVTARRLIEEAFAMALPPEKFARFLTDDDARSTERIADALERAKFGG